MIELLFAQSSTPQQPSPFAGFMPVIILFILFYFILIRPQSKRIKEHQEMLKKLKKGDRVITSGGIIGVIFEIEDDKVLLEVAPNVKIKVLKSSIQKVL
ncbi:MAG: preprotein translocase subunit YajC [Caldiserica bacterium]|nr:MAG: preprotein translocase subunit YajC [Caldisericota bacterium]